MTTGIIREASRRAGALAKAAAPVPRFLTAALAVLLASATPGRAQIEPEVFTASRLFNKAMSANPPDVFEAANLLVGYARPLHRRTLQYKWIDHLAGNTVGAVRGKRKQLGELFDAFDDSFAAGANARSRAEQFIATRDELLGRATPKKEIAESAAAFLERLHRLPEAQRSLLREFGRQAKSTMNDAVE